MFRYVICKQANARLFCEQCRALEESAWPLQKEALIEDVDGTLIQRYNHPDGVVTVKSDVQVDVVLVVSDIDLHTLFNKD